MGALLVLAAAVLVLDAYAATLVMLRGRLFGVRVYRPMLWNIVLSLVPVAAAVGGMVALLLVGAATSLVPLSGLANAVFSLGLLHLFALLLGDLEQVTLASWLWALAVLALGSLGVYLGRYLRFNSWDVQAPPAACWPSHATTSASGAGSRTWPGS